jgi:alpha-tubulin suppressor-like RCC1 family protein
LRKCDDDAVRAALVALVLAGCPGTVSKPRDLPSTPAAPEGSEPAPHVALLAAAGWRTCAVLSDGALWCWGYLMDGIADTPFAIATPRPVKRIALGLQHECVLGDDERVACRGNGRATTLAESEHARAFQYVEGLPPIVDVAAGIEETYVLTRDGRVFEWGEFSGSRRSKVPSEVKLPGRASAIAAADSHACALVAGDLWCWGRFRGRPERLGGSPRVTSMAVGQFSACGLDADHRVYCWGAPCDPLADELGGDACAIDALEGASELGGGWRKGICARFADGWRCIGDNEAGNVSARGPQWAREPLRAGPEHLATLAMGERHACGVDRDGAVLCWGNPYVSGHDEAPFLRERYRLPQSVTRPGQVAVGRALVCVNGDVAPTCWHAQGGAALIVAAAGATGIAAADARACALRDGALICWQHDETTTARVDALDARTLALAS